MTEVPEFDWAEHGDTVTDLTDSNRGEGIVFKVTEDKKHSRPLLLIKWKGGPMSYREQGDVKILKRRRG